MNNKLIFVGDNILRETALPVDAITDETRTIVKRMMTVMKDEFGAGLAAPQIGINQRMFIFTEPDEKRTLNACINPKILTESAEQIEMDEG